MWFLKRHPRFQQQLCPEAVELALLPREASKLLRHPVDQATQLRRVLMPFNL
jgi:hypothetical protein